MSRNSSGDTLNGGEILVYEAADGEVRVDVRLDEETVWLTQAQMAALFGRERSVITRHVRNVFKEGELDEESNFCTLPVLTDRSGSTTST